MNSPFENGRGRFRLGMLVATAVIAVLGWSASLLGVELRGPGRRAAATDSLATRVNALEVNQNTILFLVCAMAERETLTLPAQCRRVLR